jgi:hypothetical protein
MSEEIEVLKIVTGRLERAGIGYMVTSASAMLADLHKRVAQHRKRKKRA